jgi:hypothetical protein
MGSPPARQFVMRGLDPRIHPETVIPGRELCAKIDEVNFSLSSRTRNPEQCMVLDSGSAPKRASRNDGVFSPQFPLGTPQKIGIVRR